MLFRVECNKIVKSGEKYITRMQSVFDACIRYKAQFSLYYYFSCLKKNNEMYYYSFIIVNIMWGIQIHTGGRHTMFVNQ